MATNDTDCPVCACAEIISGKWTLLVIRDLSDGNRRFCELERSLDGISPRTLSLRRRALSPLIDDMREYGSRWLGVADNREPAAA
jgi:DNA-binding HxlR family transcriptional regulator